MNATERQDLIDWGQTVEPINGLILVKALWTGRDSIKFDKQRIILPTHLKMPTRRLQPFTMALVLNPGTGYRDLKDGSWKGSVLSPGDVIVANQFVAFEVEVDGHKVNYLPENLVLATISDFDWEGYNDVAF